METFKTCNECGFRINGTFCLRCFHEAEKEYKKQKEGLEAVFRISPVLPLLNGGIDTECLADIMFLKISDKINNHIPKKEIESYIEEVIKTIIRFQKDKSQ